MSIMVQLNNIDVAIWAQAIEKSSDCNLFQGIVIGGYLLEFVHGLGPFNGVP